MDCFVPLMEHFKQTYGFYPQYPVADAGYGSYNNYIFCEQNGIDEQGVMRCPNDKAFHFLYTTGTKREMRKNSIEFFHIPSIA